MGGLKTNDKSKSAEWKIIQQVEAADEIPKVIPANGIVLAGPLKKPHWLAFDCPCGNRHRIMVNLDSRRRPCWAMRQTNPVSIYPSFDVITGMDISVFESQQYGVC